MSTDVVGVGGRGGVCVCKDSYRSMVDIDTSRQRYVKCSQQVAMASSLPYIVNNGTAGDYPGEVCLTTLALPPPLSHTFAGTQFINED